MNHEEITDIALVVFPLTMANQLKKDWERSGKPAGGPGKFLTPEVEKKLFFELLKDIFDEAEIEEYWERSEQRKTGAYGAGLSLLTLAKCANMQTVMIVHYILFVHN